MMDETRAAQELARAACAPPAGARPFFRLWHFPPGEPWITWILFQLPKSNGLLREIRWTREEGFSTRERPLPDEDLLALRRQAEHLELDLGEVSPTLASSEFGIEGFPEIDRNAIVRWDRPVPSTLGGIAAWHSRTRARFASILDADT